MTYTVLAST